MPCSHYIPYTSDIPFTYISNKFDLVLNQRIYGLPPLPPTSCTRRPSLIARTRPKHSLIKSLKNHWFFNGFCTFSVPKSTLARHFTYIWYACGIHLKYVSNKFKVNLRSDSTEPLCEGRSPEVSQKYSCWTFYIHLICMWHTSKISFK